MSEQDYCKNNQPVSVKLGRHAKVGKEKMRENSGVETRRVKSGCGVLGKGAANPLSTS